jgi:hypothetical protein
MQRFEWAERGLVSKLSENLVPFHPSIKTSDELAAAATAAASATAAAAASAAVCQTPAPATAIATATAHKTKPKATAATQVPAANNTMEDTSVVREDHSNPHTWARVHSLRPELRSKVGRIYSYLVIEVNQTLLDFTNRGAVVLKGTEIPGTDIVSILVSAVDTANEFELGEMIILSLLRHSPRAIVRLVQESKVSFIEEEEREETFKPLLTGQRQRNNGGWAEEEEQISADDEDELGAGGGHKAKIISARANPQMTATYVPKRPRRNGLGNLISSQAPSAAMSAQKQWFDLS